MGGNLPRLPPLSSSQPEVAFSKLLTGVAKCIGSVLLLWGSWEVPSL